MVKWRTRGPFDHVEMVFSDGVTANASLRKRGVYFELDKTYDPECWEVLDVPGSCLEVKARLWWTRHQGAAFDVWGVWGFLLGFTRGDADRWFCSEACAASLGMHDPWRFDPNTLYAVMR